MTTLKLKKPVNHGSERISELTFREPTAKDMRRMPVNMKNLSPMFDMAGDLTGQPTVVIDQLSIEDSTAVLEIITDFIDGGRETETSA